MRKAIDWETLESVLELLKMHLVSNTFEILGSTDFASYIA